MYEIKKLSAMPYAQAHVEIHDNRITLVSYTTVVAEINDGWLEIYGLYSMTTRRHISAFVREYADMDYQTAKMLYTDKMRYSLENGNIEKIGE